MIPSGLPKSIEMINQLSNDSRLYIILFFWESHTRKGSGDFINDDGIINS
jgi:hypothetical protein